ncbi:MAG: hypothetical protein DCC57_02855 [Chloroflexi bacterium]|nr:MAG: hypothetical protein DCC57_02855 [Chloroflexota bacterium]
MHVQQPQELYGGQCQICPWDPGEQDGVTDMPLLRDPLQGVALLPGASLAGAQRAGARRIAQTLHGPAGQKLVDTLFGGQLPPVGKDRGKDRRPRYGGGRVEVRERVVEQTAGRTLTWSRP